MLLLLFLLLVAIITFAEAYAIPDGAKGSSSKLARKSSETDVILPTAAQCAPIEIPLLASSTPSAIAIRSPGDIVPTPSGTQDWKLQYYCGCGFNMNSMNCDAAVNGLIPQIQQWEREGGIPPRFGIHAIIGDVVAFLCNWGSQKAVISPDEYRGALAQLTGRCGRYIAGTVRVDGSVDSGIWHPTTGNWDMGYMRWRPNLNYCHDAPTSPFDSCPDSSEVKRFTEINVRSPGDVGTITPKASKYFCGCGIKMNPQNCDAAVNQFALELPPWFEDPTCIPPYTAQHFIKDDVVVFACTGEKKLCLSPDVTRSTLKRITAICGSYVPGTWDLRSEHDSFVFGYMRYTPGLDFCRASTASPFSSCPPSPISKRPNELNTRSPGDVAAFGTTHCGCGYTLDPGHCDSAVKRLKKQLWDFWSNGGLAAGQVAVGIDTDVVAFVCNIWGVANLRLHPDVLSQILASITGDCGRYIAGSIDATNGINHEFYVGYMRYFPGLDYCRAAIASPDKDCQRSTELNNRSPRDVVHITGRSSSGYTLHCGCGFTLDPRNCDSAVRELKAQMLDYYNKGGIPPGATAFGLGTNVVAFICNKAGTLQIHPDILDEYLYAITDDCGRYIAGTVESQYFNVGYMRYFRGLWWCGAALGSPDTYCPNAPPKSKRSMLDVRSIDTEPTIHSSHPVITTHFHCGCGFTLDHDLTDAIVETEKELLRDNDASIPENRAFWAYNERSVAFVCNFGPGITYSAERYAQDLAYITDRCGAYMAGTLTYDCPSCGSRSPFFSVGYMRYFPGLDPCGAANGSPDTRCPHKRDSVEPASNKSVQNRSLDTKLSVLESRETLKKETYCGCAFPIDAHNTDAAVAQLKDQLGYWYKHGGIPSDNYLWSIQGNVVAFVCNPGPRVAYHPTDFSDDLKTVTSACGRYIAGTSATKGPYTFNSGYMRFSPNLDFCGAALSSHESHCRTKRSTEIELRSTATNLATRSVITHCGCGYDMDPRNTDEAVQSLKWKLRNWMGAGGIPPGKNIVVPYGNVVAFVCNPSNDWVSLWPEDYAAYLAKITNDCGRYVAGTIEVPSVANFNIGYMRYFRGLKYCEAANASPDQTCPH